MLLGLHFVPDHLVHQLVWRLLLAGLPRDYPHKQGC